MHHISPRQLLFLTIASILARGMFVLPRTAAEIAGTGAWIVLVVQAFLLTLSMSAIVAVSIRFPGRIAAQYCELLLGKVLGKFVTPLILSTFLISLTFTTREFVEVSALLLLPKTPIEMSTAVLLLAAAYLAAQRLEIIARAATFLLPILLVTYVLLLIVSLRNIDPINLQPVFQVQGSLIQALHNSAPTFFGAQTLWVTVAYLRKSKDATKHSIGAALVVLLFLLLLTITTIGVLGVERVKQLAWPGLDAMQAATPVGSIFERYGSLLAIVWISITFLSLAVHLHAAAVTTVHWIGRPNTSLFVPILPSAILIGICSVKLFPDRVAFFESLQKSATLGWTLLYGLPFLLWLITLVRRPGARQVNAR